MSAAELTAHHIYDSNCFRELPHDVLRHIAILCINTIDDKYSAIEKSPVEVVSSEILMHSVTVEDARRELLDMVHKHYHPEAV